MGKKTPLTPEAERVLEEIREEGVQCPICWTVIKPNEIEINRESTVRVNHDCGKSFGVVVEIKIMPYKKIV